MVGFKNVLGALVGTERSVFIPRSTACLSAIGSGAARHYHNSSAPMVLLGLVFSFFALPVVGRGGS